MKGNRIVCIFAHPDDEAFGPGGTIAKYSAKKEIYLICVTNGNDVTRAGKKGLAAIRRKELKKASQILGIKKVYFLGYKDGELKNNIYHEVAGDIEKILKTIKPDTLLTFEPRGVSGHIDHVFCSLATTFVFKKLSFIKTLYYYVVGEESSKEMENYFIYFPPGYKRGDVDRIENVKNYWGKKIDAIKAHESQLDDSENVIKRFNKMPKEEYFLALKK